MKKKIIKLAPVSAPRIGLNSHPVESAHLIMKEALLHAVVSADLLQNVPSKLLVQFPGHEPHRDGEHGNDDGNRHEERAARGPGTLAGRVDFERAVGLNVRDGSSDLVDLQRGVDEQGQVRDADSNDLDGVLETQGIPGQDQLVQETKNEERQEGGYRLVVGIEHRVGAAGICP